jgi:hypothetical protein
MRSLLLKKKKMAKAALQGFCQSECQYNWQLSNGWELFYKKMWDAFFCQFEKFDRFRGVRRQRLRQAKILQQGL